MVGVSCLMMWPRKLGRVRSPSASASGELASRARCPGKVPAPGVPSRFAPAQVGILSRMPERIGVLGGTFDPIHVGHLVAAVNAHHALGLDRVILMVANVPWQKVGD